MTWLTNWRSSSRVPALAVLFGVILASSVVSARSVYLNDQNIDTIRSQKFENVTVQIDPNGNVIILSDVYRVQTGNSAATPTPAAGIPDQPERLANIPRGMRYWLVSEENAPGMSQYEFDVFVNGNLVKTIRSGEPQVVEDVSKYVLPGENTVTVSARKNFGTGRKSESKDFFQRIYVGKGALNKNGAIVIDSPEIDYRRTAADVENHADQLHFTVK